MPVRRRIVVAAAVTGMLTGAAVAAFERVTERVFIERVLRAAPPVQAVLPAAGLLLAALFLRTVARGAGPTSADEYIRSFHLPRGAFDLRPVIGRMVAAVATLGSGAPMGMEGPSIYAGVSVGTAVHRRVARWLGDDARPLLVAGAAAGVAAIFKAPATGAVFALEVPYGNDLARRALVPALVGAASSYVVFAAIEGTTPLLPVRGTPPFDWRDLGGAIVVGVGAGLAARVFAGMIGASKRVWARLPRVVAAIGAGAVLAGLYVLTYALTDEPLSIGPGYHTVEWALNPSRGAWLVAAVLVIRMAGTSAAVAGGGVGGLFVPLVVQGALLGRLAGGLFGDPHGTLFPVIGIAAFLGAGYRVPLAAVMFVAEFTGRPGFVVPGLLAAVAAHLAVGRASLSNYQVDERGGHLERRLALPLTSAVQTGAAPVAPDDSVDEVFWHHLVGRQQRSVAVVRDGVVVGIVAVQDIESVPRDAWATTPAHAVVRSDVPVGRPSWSMGQALRAMEGARLDALVITDDGGSYLGVVTLAEVLRLDEVL